MGAGKNYDWYLVNKENKKNILRNSGTLNLPSDNNYILKLEPSRPDEFILHQNFPNPFNAKTSFSYELTRNVDDFQLSIYHQQFY